MDADRVRAALAELDPDDLVEVLSFAVCHLLEGAGLRAFAADLDDQTAEDLSFALAQVPR